MGVDIADELLGAARSLAAREGLDIEYQHGDAERLSFRDAELDAVISTFGVMFASNPGAAAAEIARVVKPGGRVVLSTWTADGNVAAMFGVMKPLLPAAPTPPTPSPFAWGRVETLRELLGASFELSFEQGTNCFRYASGASAWELWREHYGPMKSLSDRLDDERREQFVRALSAWHETFATPLGYEQPRTYVIARGVRR